VITGVATWCVGKTPSPTRSMPRLCAVGAAPAHPAEDPAQNNRGDAIFTRGTPLEEAFSEAPTARPQATILPSPHRSI
jgi:hypothetical protein